MAVGPTSPAAPAPLPAPAAGSIAQPGPGATSPPAPPPGPSAAELSSAELSSAELSSAPPWPDDVTLAAGPPWEAAAGRSPLAGDRESTPLPATRIGEVRHSDSQSPPEGPVVPWDQAHRHVGETLTVEGRIVNTHRSRSDVVFLNFDRDWEGKFYVPVFRGAYEAMPTAAERFFLNQTVRVTGKVELYNGTPNIAVNRLSQIRVVR